MRPFPVTVESVAAFLKSINAYADNYSYTSYNDLHFGLFATKHIVASAHYANVTTIGEVISILTEKNKSVPFLSAATKDKSLARQIADHIDERVTATYCVGAVVASLPGVDVLDGLAASLIEDHEKVKAAIRAQRNEYAGYYPDSPGKIVSIMDISKKNFHLDGVSVKAVIIINRDRSTDVLNAIDIFLDGILIATYDNPIDPHDRRYDYSVLKYIGENGKSPRIIEAIRQIFIKNDDVPREMF